MYTSQIYLAVSVGVLVIVALLTFLVRGERRENRLTSQASLAFGFILAGILFGDERLIGYSLLGVGVILAVYDMFKRLKSR